MYFNQVSVRLYLQKQEQLKKLGSEHRELLTKTISSNSRKVETVRSKVKGAV